MIEHKEPARGGTEHIKSNEETGFEARDFEAAIATLSKVGLEKVGLPSIKRRVSYVRDYSDPDNKVRLDFDTYSNLKGKSIPEFLEIEATNSEKLYTTAEALGIERSDCKKYGPEDLFKHYYQDEEVI